MKNLIIMLFVSALFSCKGDFIVQKTERAVCYKTTQSCSTTGYCYSCLPGFDGRMQCGFKFSALCPGQQKVEVCEVTEHGHFSKKPEIERTRKRVISTLTLEECRQ